MTYENIREQLRPFDEKLVNAFPKGCDAYNPLIKEMEGITTNYLLEQFGTKYPTARVGRVNMDGTYLQSGSMQYEALISVEFDHHADLSDQTTLVSLTDVVKAATELKHVHETLKDNYAILGIGDDTTVYCNDGSLELTITTPIVSVEEETSFSFNEYCRFIADFGNELRRF